MDLKKGIVEFVAAAEDDIVAGCYLSKFIIMIRVHKMLQKMSSIEAKAWIE